MKFLVIIFGLVIVADAFPNWPIYPDVGAIYKGPDSAIIIEGPDGSVIKSIAEDGVIATNVENSPALVNVPEIVTPSIVEEPETVVPTTVPPVQPIPVQSSLDTAQNTVLQPSVNIAGPSGKILTSGRNSIISGPASITIAREEHVPVANPIELSPHLTRINVEPAPIVEYSLVPEIPPVLFPPTVGVSVEALEQVKAAARAAGIASLAGRIVPEIVTTTPLLETTPDPAVPVIVSEEKIPAAVEEPATTTELPSASTAVPETSHGDSDSEGSDEPEESEGSSDDTPDAPTAEVNPGLLSQPPLVDVAALPLQNIQHLQIISALPDFSQWSLLPQQLLLSRLLTDIGSADVAVTVAPELITKDVRPVQHSWPGLAPTL